jgi:uncharacterized RDD family membrane protein YckC
MTDQPPPPPGGYQPPPREGGYPPPPPPSGYPPPPQQGGYPPPPAGTPGYPPAPAGALPKEAYTPWFTRVLGYVIDVVPAAVVIGIGAGIAFGTADNQCTSGGGYDYYCTSSMTAFGMIVYILAYALVFAYWIWNWGYRQGTTGQSIGKSVMKFKVISEKTGQPIGFGLSIVRQIAHVVDSLVCYIGWLFPLWDAKRQTLADKIMSTICLPAEQPTLNPQPLPPQQ